MHISLSYRVMSKSPSVDTVDLYDYVIDKCGKIPYKNCSIMKKPEDVVNILSILACFIYFHCCPGRHDIPSELSFVLNSTSKTEK